MHIRSEGDRRWNTVECGVNGCAVPEGRGQDYGEDSDVQFCLVLVHKFRSGTAVTGSGILVERSEGSCTSYGAS